MNHVHSSSRGQASLEFILVLIFMLVIIVAVIVPLGQRIQFAMEDVSKVSFSDAGLNLIQSTLNNLLLSPGTSRQFVDVYLPKGSSLACDNLTGSINITFPLNTDVFDATGSIPLDCSDNTDPFKPTVAMFCSKSVSFPASAELRCQGDALSTGGFLLETGQAGFSQRFRMFARYFPGGTPLYVVDFNAV